VLEIIGLFAGGGARATLNQSSPRLSKGRIASVRREVDSSQKITNNLRDLCG